MLLINIDYKSPIKRSQNHLISLFLVISVLICYWQVKDFEFINFDDPTYVTDNQAVLSGINKDSIIWAFSFEDKSNTYWHPLSWLSHMLDVQLYGLNPGQHHLTNVIFHCLNSLLLFFVLLRTTGAIWQSALVATLFAVHPINVESVAWVTERKNVLSTFFCLLTLMTYAFYTEKPGNFRYAVMFICFVLGLLAKPMLVTLPFVLLLLDNWPLDRLNLLQPGAERWRILFNLFLEKIPLFLTSGLSIYLASASIQNSGLYISLQSTPVTLRIANALVSYIKYIGILIWPQNLAVFYPFPRTVGTYQILGALLVIVCISILVMTAYKKQTYLMIGWFWFLGTFVPVIGLIQAGLWPALADRWAYVPMIGLFIILAWGLFEILARWPLQKFKFAVILLMVAGCLMAVSWKQIGYWKNSVTLFNRAVVVTKNNFIAQNNLGHALLMRDEITEAAEHFRKSSEINPGFAAAHLNMAMVLDRQGKLEQAIKHYVKALEIKPNNTDAHNNLGSTWYRLGRTDKAYAHYLAAIKINPAYADAYNNLGAVSIRMGDPKRAVFFFGKALKINPESESAQNNLNKALSALEMINDNSAASK